MEKKLRLNLENKINQAWIWILEIHKWKIRMSIGCTNYYCLNPIYIVQISFRPLIFFSTVTLFSFTVALCRSRFLLKKFYCYCNDHPHAPFPFFSPHFFLSTVSLPPHSFSPFSFSSLLDSRLFISSSFFLTFPLPSPPHKTSFLPLL